MSDQKIDPMYGLFGSVISAPPAVVTCTRCGHSCQMARRPKRIDIEGDVLIVTFAIAKNDGCPKCGMEFKS